MFQIKITYYLNIIIKNMETLYIGVVRINTYLREDTGIPSCIIRDKDAYQFSLRLYIS